MKGVNKVIIVGTLGKDPEVRYTPNGDPVAKVSIATNEKYKDQERTEWHTVVFFGKLADVVSRYLTKGATCYVEGKLRTEKYTDKNGIEKYITKIMANNLTMLGGGSEQSERPPQQRPQAQQPYGSNQTTNFYNNATQPAQQPSNNDFDFDDDIPF